MNTVYRMKVGGRVTGLAGSCVLVVWSLAVLYVFARFCVLSYAHKDLTAPEVNFLSSSNSVFTQFWLV